MIGLILLYQNTFNHFESWAYAWAMIPVAVAGIFTMVFAASRNGLFALSSGNTANTGLEPLDALDMFGAVVDRLATVFDFERSDCRGQVAELLVAVVAWIEVGRLFADDLPHAAERLAHLHEDWQRQPLQVIHAGNEGVGKVRHGIGQREKVVVGRGRCGKVGRQPQDVPAARGGQSFGVLGTQVIGMRFGISGQRSEHGRLVGIDVGQGRYGWRRARGPRAPTRSCHSPERNAPIGRALP